MEVKRKDRETLLGDGHTDNSTVYCFRVCSLNTCINNKKHPTLCCAKKRLKTKIQKLKKMV